MPLYPHLRYHANFDKQVDMMSLFEVVENIDFGFKALNKIFYENHLFIPLIKDSNFKIVCRQLKLKIHLIKMRNMSHVFPLFELNFENSISVATINFEWIKNGFFFFFFLSLISKYHHLPTYLYGWIRIKLPIFPQTHYCTIEKTNT